MESQSTNSGHNNGDGNTTNSTPQPFQIPAYVLDDLCSRFIINIPEEERKNPIRIFFQIELAHWFYLDFFCIENLDLRTCGIKDFSSQIFRHCPFLNPYAEEVDKRLEDWKQYKMSVPTYGAAILDPAMKYCLLVQGFWAKSSWGFPKGKVNEKESPKDCAVREVLEETGFDISNLINQQDYLENQLNYQVTRLYIVPGVPLETKFQPKTRKEIKSMQWFPVDALPAHKKDQTSRSQLRMNSNNFFTVIPFIKSLRKWIANRKSTLECGLSWKAASSSKGSKLRETGEGRQPSEKQRQKQQQLFVQQVQNDFLEFMKFKDGKPLGDSPGNNVKPRADSTGNRFSVTTASKFHSESTGNKFSKSRSNSPGNNSSKSRPESTGSNFFASHSESLRNNVSRFRPNSTGSKVSQSSADAAGNNLLKPHHQNLSPKQKSNTQIQILTRNKPVNAGMKRNSEGLHSRTVPPVFTSDLEFRSDTWLNFKLDVEALLSCLP